MLVPLPSTYATTRDALHVIAEHVIAPARYQRDNHIGLVPTAGGYGTPRLDNGECIRVEGTELVYEQPGSTRRMAITTPAAAAAFVGVPLGVPANLYPPATKCVPDERLPIDGDGERTLAAWYAFVAAQLDDVRNAHPTHSPTASTIWPEHFDLACELGDADAGTRANFGASAGDDAIAEPYVYVGPWDDTKRTGVFGRCRFGAALTYDELQATGDAGAAAHTFYFDCAAHLLG